jgi:hypothetical protein
MMDSNHRMAESKSAALNQLGESPNTKYLKTGDNMIINRGFISNIDLAALNEKCYRVANMFKMMPRIGNVISSHSYTVNRNNRMIPDFKAEPIAMPHTWPECTDLVDTIRACTLAPIMNSWFNIVPTGGSTGPHIHDFVKDSAFVFYTQLNDSHPAFEYLENDQWIPVRCRAGEWIRFAGNLLHRVPKNQSRYDRLSFGLNT